MKRYNKEKVQAFMVSVGGVCDIGGIFEHRCTRHNQLRFLFSDMMRVLILNQPKQSMSQHNTTRALYTSTKAPSTTDEPSNQPSTMPSTSPSDQPSTMPSTSPSDQPSTMPSTSPSDQPSTMPSTSPSDQPSTMPSTSPSGQPSRTATRSPTSSPTISPTYRPSWVPSWAPTLEIDRTFTIRTLPLDDSSRDWCVDAYEGLRAGRFVGVRPCVDQKKSQIWQFDEENQLHTALKYNLCLSINDDNLLYLISCPTNRRKLGKGTGITTWKISNDGILIALANDKDFASALQPLYKYNALTVVSVGSTKAMKFLQEFGAITFTTSPTVAPTFDGQTAAPTTFLSQTFEIQSTFKFDDSTRPWCLQAINIRLKANLNMRPCEGRKKQQWLITEDGKIRLKGAPTYCIANVQGKILQLGYCKNGVDGTDPSDPKRNISTFAYDRDKGELTATNIRGETFYFGFNSETKYNIVRLQNEGDSESQTFWKTNGV